MFFIDLVSHLVSLGLNSLAYSSLLQLLTSAISTSCFTMQFRGLAILSIAFGAVLVQSGMSAVLDLGSQYASF